MTVLLPYYILSAALSLVTCVSGEWVGLTFVCLLAAFFLAYLAGLLLLTVLFLWIISLPVDKERPQRTPSPFYRRALDLAMGLISVICGVKLRVNGIEKMPEGYFLFVCNHRSAFDPIVTGWALRRYKMAFISKPENLNIPIVGKIIHKCSFMSIDRENDREALKTILFAIDLVKRGAASVAVYPEGTRNTADGLLPFRNGAFKIAQKAQVPVVIAVISGSDNVKRNMFRRRTEVRLDIRRVMSAESLSGKTTAEIADEVRACMLGEKN